MRFLMKVALMGGLGLLTGCSQGLQPHGILFNDEELAKLPGMNRNQIESTFGKAHYVSAKNPNTVYYLGYQAEDFYLFSHEVRFFQTIEIAYDGQQIAKAFKPVKLRPQLITPLGHETKAPELETDWQILLGTESTNPMN